MRLRSLIAVSKKHMILIDMLHHIRKSIVLALLMAVGLWAPVAIAQSGRSPALPEERLKSGASTMRAFRPVVESVRESIVKLSLDGKAAALGVLIDTNGFILSKASEIKEGKLTCELASGTEADVELVARDDDNDVALLRAKITDGKPINWVMEDSSVGQWVVTPGIERTPEAVGIVSVPPRKILPKRAIIGVEPNIASPSTRIAKIYPGLGADKAGLKSGDVILSVNKTLVTTWAELSKTLRQFRIGQTVKLLVQREEEEFEVNVQMMPEQLANPPQFGRRSGANRQDVMNRMGGKLSERAEGFELAIQHDTVLQPWQCGGPLVNLEGKAIGLNIARAGRVASYALPASLIKQIIEELKAQAQERGTEKDPS
jgi:serine protease Do